MGNRDLPGALIKTAAGLVLVSDYRCKQAGTAHGLRLLRAGDDDVPLSLEDTALRRGDTRFTFHEENNLCRSVRRFVPDCDKIPICTALTTALPAWDYLP